MHGAKLSGLGEEPRLVMAGFIPLFAVIQNKCLLILSINT
jgi:hypothetical protein